MATITTAAVAVLILLLLPALILWRLSLTPRQHARRMRRAGHRPKAIGARLGVSHQQITAWCLA